MVRCASPPVKYPLLPSFNPLTLLSPTVSEPTSGLRANTSRRRIRRIELERNVNERSRREKKLVHFQEAARRLDESIHPNDARNSCNIGNIKAMRDPNTSLRGAKSVLLVGQPGKTSREAESSDRQSSSTKLGSSAARSLLPLDGLYNALAVDAEELEPLNHSFALPAPLSPFRVQSELFESEEDDVHSTHGVPLVFPTLQDTYESARAQRASIDTWLQEVEEKGYRYGHQRATLPRFSAVGRNVLPPPNEQLSIANKLAGSFSPECLTVDKENQHPGAEPSSHFSKSSSSTDVASDASEDRACPSLPLRNPLRSRVAIPEGSPLRARPRRSPLHSQETMSQLLKAAPKSRGRAQTKLQTGKNEPAEKSSEKTLEMQQANVNFSRKSRRQRRDRKSIDDEDLFPNFAHQLRLELELADPNPREIVVPRTRTRAATAKIQARRALLEEMNAT